MRIRLALTFDFDGKPDRLREQLLAWALHGNYRLEEEQPGRWVFRRGSTWGALFVLTDIYRLPCEVIVLHMPISHQIAVSLECTSWFHVATWGDQSKLETELGRLRVMVCDPDAGRWERESGPRGEGIEPAGPFESK
jgi:hypothetical protein